MTNLVGWSKDGERYTNLILGVLGMYWPVRILHRFEKSVIAEYENDWYLLGDNGGEINVWHINVNDPRPSIPTSISVGTLPTTSTTAYRLARSIMNKPVEWDFEIKPGDLPGPCEVMSVYTQPLDTCSSLW